MAGSARGLEWLYRLVKEPKRLWKRYLVTNTHYLALFAKHAVLMAVGRFPRKPAKPGVLADDSLDEELTAAA